MRAALSLTRRVSARGASATALSPRSSAESSELSEACNAALQAQERAFSSGGMLRYAQSRERWLLPCGALASPKRLPYGVCFLHQILRSLTDPFRALAFRFLQHARELKSLDAAA